MSHYRANLNLQRRACPSVESKFSPSSARGFVFNFAPFVWRLRHHAWLRRSGHFWFVRHFRKPRYSFFREREWLGSKCRSSGFACCGESSRDLPPCVRASASGISRLCSPKRKLYRRRGDKNSELLSSLLFAGSIIPSLFAACKSEQIKTPVGKM